MTLEIPQKPHWAIHGQPTTDPYLGKPQIFTKQLAPNKPSPHHRRMQRRGALGAPAGVQPLNHPMWLSPWLIHISPHKSHKSHKQDFTARGRLDPKVPCQVWQLDKGSTSGFVGAVGSDFITGTIRTGFLGISQVYPHHIPIVVGFIPPFFIIFPHPTPGTQVVALLLIARHGLHHLQVTGTR